MELLDTEISREKQNIHKKSYAYSLIRAHISKASHNLKFSHDTGNQFMDWKIIGLYYSVYHSALALLAKKGYITKSHNATFLMLLKLYILSKEDIDLVDELRFNAEDAEFYTHLKEERGKANYSTNIAFSIPEYKKLRDRTIIFMDKAKNIINNTGQ